MAPSSVNPGRCHRDQCCGADGIDTVLQIIPTHHTGRSGTIQLAPRSDDGRQHPTRPASVIAVLFEGFQVEE